MMYLFIAILYSTVCNMVMDCLTIVIKYLRYNKILQRIYAEEYTVKYLNP